MREAGNSAAPRVVSSHASERRAWATQARPGHSAIGVDERTTWTPSDRQRMGEMDRPAQAALLELFVALSQPPEISR